MEEVSAREDALLLGEKHCKNLHHSDHTNDKKIGKLDSSFRKFHSAPVNMDRFVASTPPPSVYASVFKSRCGQRH